MKEKRRTEWEDVERGGKHRRDGGERYTQGGRETVVIFVQDVGLFSRLPNQNFCNTSLHKGNEMLGFKISLSLNVRHLIVNSSDALHSSHFKINLRQIPEPCFIGHHRFWSSIFLPMCRFRQINLFKLQLILCLEERY